MKTGLSLLGFGLGKMTESSNFLVTMWDNGANFMVFQVRLIEDDLKGQGCFLSSLV